MAAAGDATPFVGRERELETLRRALEELRGGRGGVVLIEGSGGMGASRLLDEALRAPGGGLGETGTGPRPVVLRSDALPAWRAAPYGPIVVALERELRRRTPGEVAALLAPRAEVLAPLLPVSTERAAIRAGAPPAGHRLERTLEAVRDLIGRLGGGDPVVLVVEDLHASDAATRGVVAFLARTTVDPPILLLLNVRPDELGRSHPVHTTLAAIEAVAHPPVRMRLEGVDQRALGRLVEAFEGERPSARLLLLVAERSRGNPLVAQELLAARRDLSSTSLAVPFDQLVRQRVGRRTIECRRVLRVLSLARGPLDPRELAAIAAAYDTGFGRPAPRSTARPRRSSPGLDADLAAGLAEAVAIGLAVREADAVDGSDRYRIRHDLVADAIAADLLPAQRRWMHAAVATATAHRPAEAVAHRTMAHDPAGALAASLDAAAAAERLGAGADALVHLERAIELEATQPGAHARPELLVAAADAAAASADHQRAAAFLQVALAGVGADRGEAARLWERLGDVRWEAGERDDALAAFERADELMAPRPAEDRARVRARLAQSRMLVGAFSEAERTAREALALASAADPPATAVAGHATCTLGALAGWHGRVDEAIDLLREALAIATDLHRPDDEFRARANLATILGLEGRHAEAIEVTLEGVAAAERDGLEGLHGNLLRGQAAAFLFVAGRWREAREIALRALAWAPTGQAFINAAASFLTVDVEMTYGADAASILGRLLLELEIVPDDQAAIQAQSAAATMALWRGDTSDARRAIDTAWRRIRGTEDWVLQADVAATALAVASTASAAARDRRDAAALASLREWAGEIVSTARSRVAAAGVDTATYAYREAEAYLATAEAFQARVAGRDRPATWRALAGRWSTMGRRYEAALARWHEAEVHLAGASTGEERRAGRDEARDCLVAAAEVAVALDAGPLMRAIRELAERARIQLPGPLADRLGRADAAVPVVEEAAVPPRSRPPRQAVGRGEAPEAETFGLSARERGVLAEIVAGRTNREIGERLYISEKTVGVHVGNILAKLGVAGRVEAATVALRLGLVDDLAVDARRPGPSGPGPRRGGRRAV